MNTYIYVLNNPLKYVDPTGLDTLCPGQSSIIDPVTHQVTCVGPVRPEPPQCVFGECAVFPPAYKCPYLDLECFGSCITITNTNCNTGSDLVNCQLGDKRACAKCGYTVVDIPIYFYCVIKCTKEKTCGCQ